MLIVSMVLMLLVIVMYLYIAHLHGIKDGKQDIIDELLQELKRKKL